MTRSLDSLKAFVADSGDVPEFQPEPGIVVLGSGKGGTGTSFISALIALTASRSGSRVLLVDADETAGTLHLMFGFPSGGPGLGALRGSGVTPDQLLVPVVPDLLLLPGGGGHVDATFAVAPSERRALMRRVSGLYDHFDLVIVDGGSRLDSVMAACSVGAERLLCVTTTGRIALASTYALVKVARARFRGMPMELVVNGASHGAALDTHAVVQSASASFLGSSIDFGGAVPEDAGARIAVSNGQPLQELPGDSPAFESAARMAHGLVRATATLREPPTSTLSLHPTPTLR